MVKRISVLLFAVFVLFSSELSSQVKPKEFNLGGSLGFSLLGDLFKRNISGTGVDLRISPVINATFDYRISSKYSLGLAFSHQYLDFKVQDYYYRDENGVMQKIFLNGNINRKNFAFRFLFHYGTMDQLDFYSGMRIGYTFWSYKSNVSNLFDEVGMPDMMIAPQIILFGTRAYITDNLAANFELNLGSPYYTTMGLNYKF